jgi:hypothetical protein
MNQQVYDMMHRIGLIPDLVAEEHVFATFREARDWLGRS